MDMQQARQAGKQFVEQKLQDYARQRAAFRIDGIRWTDDDESENCVIWLRAKGKAGMGVPIKNVDLEQTSRRQWLSNVVLVVWARTATGHRRGRMAAAGPLL